MIMNKSELIESLRNIVKPYVQDEDAFENLSEDTLVEVFPIQVFKDKEKMTIEFFLIHLYGHFQYHLGQIAYFRRILDAE